jgi:hypothetical protein
MRAVLPEPFLIKLLAAPPAVQRTFLKHLRFLLRDLRHPSLNAKKFPESGDPDLWQARVTDDWRFYFRIGGDSFVLDSIRSHPK